MVYSTCSSHPEENEEVVSAALEQAQACSGQEGEPKQAVFRSVHHTLIMCASCLSHHGCQPAALPVSLPSDGLLPSSASDSSFRRFSENIIKGAISCL